MEKIEKIKEIDGNQERGELIKENLSKKVMILKTVILVKYAMIFFLKSMNITKMRKLLIEY